MFYLSIWVDSLPLNASLEMSVFCKPFCNIDQITCHLYSLERRQYKQTHYKNQQWNENYCSCYTKINDIRNETSMFALKKFRLKQLWFRFLPRNNLPQNCISLNSKFKFDSSLCLWYVAQFSIFGRMFEINWIWRNFSSTTTDWKCEDWVDSTTVLSRSWKSLSWFFENKFLLFYNLWQEL